MTLPTRDDIETNADDPKSLFKFYGINEYSLSCLLRREVWISDPGSFNDPFDTFVESLSEEGDEHVRKVLAAANAAREEPYSDEVMAEGWEAMREALGKIEVELRRAGIFSMSASPYELLMWSHYGANHRGFCIEYERAPDNSLGQKADRVLYTSRRRGLLKAIAETGDLGEAVRAVLTSKAPCWQYEREWRLSFFVGEDGVRSMKLDAPIKSVVLGMRISAEHKATLIHAFRQEPEVPFYLMQMHPTEYELVPVPVTVNWETSSLEWQ